MPYVDKEDMKKYQREWARRKRARLSAEEKDKQRLQQQAYKKKWKQKQIEAGLAILAELDNDGPTPCLPHNNREE